MEPGVRTDVNLSDRYLSRLLDAGEALAHEVGSFDFGVRDVVARASVSLRTFYRYFETRDDFVLAIFARANRRFAERLAESMPKGSRASRFRHFVYAMVVPSWWSTQLSQRSAMVGETFHLREVRPEGFQSAIKPVRDILVELLGTGEDRERDIDTVYNSLLHEVYVNMISRHVDAEPVAEHLFRYHRRALRI